MEYILIKSTKEDIDILKKYKKETIIKWADELTFDLINRINEYIDENVPKELKNYKNIVVNNKIIGCLLVYPKDDGILLDEIYLEEEYRNNGIGTNIIEKIIKDNNIIYLWVYKANKKAINLYKKLDFKVIEESDSRYYMKYEK